MNKYHSLCSDLVFRDSRHDISGELADCLAQVAKMIITAGAAVSLFFVFHVRVIIIVIPECQLCPSQVSPDSSQVRPQRLILTCRFSVACSEGSRARKSVSFLPHMLAFC